MFSKNELMWIGLGAFIGISLLIAMENSRFHNYAHVSCYSSLLIANIIGVSSKWIRNSIALILAAMVGSIAAFLYAVPLPFSGGEMFNSINWLGVFLISLYAYGLLVLTRTIYTIIKAFSK